MLENRQEQPNQATASLDILKAYREAITHGTLHLDFEGDKNHADHLRGILDQLNQKGYLVSCAPLPDRKYLLVYWPREGETQNA